MNVQLVQETHIFTTMLASCDSRDCVVFITNNGMQSEMQAIAKVVVDYHIPIITITSSSKILFLDVRYSTRLWTIR